MTWKTYNAILTHINILFW